jgi:hypothetical protein
MKMILYFLYMGIALYTMFYYRNLLGFFNNLKNYYDNGRSLYRKFVQSEREKKQTYIYTFAFINFMKFLYNALYEESIFYFRQRLFPPIFLNNNKMLFPLFVHNEIKYVLMSNKSEVTRSDIIYVDIENTNKQTLTKKQQKIQKIFPHILNINKMEELYPEDLEIDKVSVHILTKFFNMETKTFQQEQPIIV